MENKGIITRAKDFTTRKRNEIQTAAVALSAAAMTNEMIGPIAMAVGKETSFGKKLNTAFDAVRDAIIYIGGPLFGCIAAICIIIMLAGSGQKVQMAKDWLVRAAIAYVALVSVSAIVDFVTGLVTG